MERLRPALPAAQQPPTGTRAVQRLVPGAWRSREPGEPPPRGQGSELWHHEGGHFQHAGEQNCVTAAGTEGAAGGAARVAAT